MEKQEVCTLSLFVSQLTMLIILTLLFGCYILNFERF